MTGDADLVVLGGGPAGSAAAIRAAQAGLRTTVLDRAEFPRPRPGETMHPGAGVVLHRLGVGAAVDAASPIRPDTQVVAWGSAPRVVPYGGDGRGAWRAFQVPRETLDAILLSRAEQLGVTVLRPVPRPRPLLRCGRVEGVQVGGDRIMAPFVIDATGANGCLRWALGLDVSVRSPRLTASYGYVRRERDRPPRLDGDEHGWTWTAQVGPAVAHWCRLPFRAGRSRVDVPPSLRRCPTIGAVRAADVTWRRVGPAAGPGYLLAGDAAFVVDPASAHGVLRALMSGMRAASGVVDVLAGRAHPVRAARGYDSWIRAWFEHDVARLTRLYDEISPQWHCGSAVPSPRERVRA